VSSPDNDGTGRYRQTIRALLASQTGATRLAGAPNLVLRPLELAALRGPGRCGRRSGGLQEGPTR
jgi:hypothetical protein